MSYPISIRELDAMTLACVPHTGPYMAIGQAFGRLSELLAGQREPVVQGRALVGVYLDDPATVAADKLRSLAGIVWPSAMTVEPPLTVHHIAGGEHAVLRFTGHYAGLGAAYQWLYAEWLPASGRRPAASPVFEVYLNTPRDTAPENLITEICLPLQAPAR